MRPKGRSFYRGEQFLDYQMLDSAAEKFRPMCNIRQQYIEQYQWDAIAREPLIETRWQSRVTGIEDTDAGVTFSVEGPKDTYALSSGWYLPSIVPEAPRAGSAGLAMPSLCAGASASPGNT